MTAFYDCMRLRGREFFDYPQHFAFVGDDTNATHPLPAEDQITARIAPTGSCIVQASLDRLPSVVPSTQALLTDQAYERVSVDAFLEGVLGNGHSTS